MILQKQTSQKKDSFTYLYFFNSILINNFTCLQIGIGSLFLANICLQNSSFLGLQKGFIVILEVKKVSVSCLTMMRLLTQCLTKYECFHVSMELNYNNKYKYIRKCYKNYQKLHLSNESFCCFVFDNFFLILLK